MRETNDCTVLSISQAYDIPYEVSYAILKSLGRKDCFGFYPQPKLLRLLKDTFEYQNQFEQKKFNCANLTNGTYLVLVKGHMFCVKDGKALDGLDNSGKRIQQVFRITKPMPENLKELGVILWTE